MNFKNLNKEINISKKFIVLLILINLIVLGLYSSYAYFQISVIQSNVVVIQTGVVDITTTITGYENQTFTLASGETKNITVTLSSTQTNSIGYKMYYDITSGISNFIVTSTETFENDIVEGEMTTSKTISFTFQNTGDNDITLVLGTQGGLIGYPIPLEQGIELKVNEELGVPINKVITTAVNNPSNTSCKTYVEEDGITYISGTKDCIDFNYVWYSGKLWRITAIYPDGTMKMITDDVITSINWGEDGNFYVDESTSSWIYQWLNEDFLDTLYNHENIIVEDSKWNVTQGKSGYPHYKLPETTMINARVGLLNTYEYYMNYKNSGYSNGYLNIGYSWWHINFYSPSHAFYATNYGNSSTYTIDDLVGVRPVINLKSLIMLDGGSGTLSDPYKIKGDKEDTIAGVTLLNTRISGEYVKLNEELYRIMAIENENTKLIKLDYVEEDSTILKKQFSSRAKFGSSLETGSDDYWDYYLNNTWLKELDSTYDETYNTSNMLAKGTYYLNDENGRGYKSTICSTYSNTVSTKECEKTTNTWIGYVGLPRFGEMFATQTNRDYTNKQYMWLITTFGTQSGGGLVCVIYEDGKGACVGNSTFQPSNTYAVHPTIHLKSEIVIIGGSGLEGDPYTVALPTTE